MVLVLNSLLGALLGAIGDFLVNWVIKNQLKKKDNRAKGYIHSGQKSGYYTAILSGKNDRGLWSVSTAEQFANSSLRRKGFYICTQNAQDLNRI